MWMLTRRLRQATYAVMTVLICIVVDILTSEIVLFPLRVMCINYMHTHYSPSVDNLMDRFNQVISAGATDFTTTYWRHQLAGFKTWFVAAIACVITNVVMYVAMPVFTTLLLYSIAYEHVCKVPGTDVADSSMYMWQFW